MPELELRFDPADSEEGVNALISALAGSEGVELREPDGGERLAQSLYSQTALGVVIVTQTAFVLRPVLLTWMGRGKRVRLKTEKADVILENMTPEEIDRVLVSIDSRTAAFDDSESPA